MKYIGKAAITRSTSAARSQMNGLKNQVEESFNRGQRNEVEWSDFNYPPVLRLFHYSTNKLKNPILRFARVLHYNFLIFLVISAINFLNNIVISASDVDPGVYIFYSLLNVFVFAPFALFVFYSGYYGIVKRPRTGFHLTAYKISQGIQCALYFTFSIIRLGPFCGWAQIAKLDGKGGEGFAIFLCVVEALMYKFLCLIGLVWLFLSFRYQDEEPLKDVQENETDVRV